MKRSFPGFVMTLVAVLAMTLTACDARLTLVPPADNNGGESEGEGEGEGEGQESFCALQPADAAFPVKVLYVVDVSGSLQFVDASNRRLAAVNEHVSELAALDADVQVAILGWGAGVFTLPRIDEASDERFIDPSAYTPPSFMALQDVATDTQGALGHAYEHILSDALLSTPDERLRTRYVVLFVTDGLPDPRCCVEQDEGGADPSGCPREPWETEPQPGARICEGRTEPELCNNSEFLDQFRAGWDGIVGPEAGDVPNYGVPFIPFSDFELRGDRNRVAQLEDSVRLLRSVVGFGVGAVEARFFLLENPTLADGVREMFDLSECRLHATVEALAQAVDSEATIVTSEALDFSDVDVTPVCPSTSPQ